MIFFLAKGRLGNHIFQMGFLKKYNKTKVFMVLPEIGDFFDLFDMPRNGIWFPRNRVLRSIFYRYIDSMMGLLARWRVISSVQQGGDVVDGWLVPATRISEKQGLFNAVTYVNEGFFQSDECFEPGFRKELTIQRQYLDRAAVFLAKTPEDMTSVFIHVRRTDYLDWQVMGASPLLPESYYRRAIAEIQAKIKDAHFILLGDDVGYLERNFDFLTSKSVSQESQEVDFAIMTLCRAGVISNSSFAWWAGYLMADDAMVLAPKFWLGIHSQIWWPEGIHTNRFTYIDAAPD